ncbi:hypothetical protein evm_000183 [Chilo suppressalis]|nr:hypothetical protein evm_000183 [Chilo suppressalis]
MEAARRALLWAAVVVPLLAARADDIVFKVPEVLVRHAAASKSVGTGRANMSRTHNGSEQWAGEDHLLEVRYEEYFVEHDISTADARRAAAQLNLENVPVSREGCGTCSRSDMEYCETRVLADHCCCERSYLPDPFPWLPHTCYTGPHRCRPMAHDCANYARRRDCCCHRKLAERWKSILSNSTRLGISGASLLLLSILLLVAHL